jgi:hypothetical protein
MGFIQIYKGKRRKEMINLISPSIPIQLTFILGHNKYLWKCSYLLRKMFFWTYYKNLKDSNSILNNT